jgi:hypothetical protein
MANPILKQAVRRKLRVAHREGLASGAIKAPKVPIQPWWVRLRIWWEARRRARAPKPIGDDTA